MTALVVIAVIVLFIGLQLYCVCLRHRGRRLQREWERAFGELDPLKPFRIAPCRTCGGGGFVYARQGDVYPQTCPMCEGIGQTLQRLPKEGVW